MYMFSMGASEKPEVELISISLEPVETNFPPWMSRVKESPTSWPSPSRKERRTEAFDPEMRILAQGMSRASSFTP